MGAKSPLPALEHIAEAVGQIQSVIAGKSFEAVFRDPVLRAAIERWIEIISEASRRLPEEMKLRHPNIPWRQVANVGNVLRHDYDGVLPDLIWEIVTRDLAPLEKVIADLIADWRSNNPTP